MLFIEADFENKGCNNAYRVSISENLALINRTGALLSRCELGGWLRQRKLTYSNLLFLQQTTVEVSVRGAIKGVLCAFLRRRRAERRVKNERRKGTRRCRYYKARVTEKKRDLLARAEWTPELRSFLSLRVKTPTECLSLLPARRGI